MPRVWEKMSNRFNGISLPLQKVIDLGEIDRWLRGVAEIVPGRIISSSSSVCSLSDGAHDFHSHSLHYGNSHLITERDIERMVGFRQLLASASQQNVRVDIDDHGGGHLEVCFTPNEPFRRSRVFGACYTNVLPVIFSPRHPSSSLTT